MKKLFTLLALICLFNMSAQISLGTRTTLEHILRRLAFKLQQLETTLPRWAITQLQALAIALQWAMQQQQAGAPPQLWGLTQRQVEMDLRP